jgi:hypothetical protein
LVLQSTSPPGTIDFLTLAGNLAPAVVFGKAQTRHRSLTRQSYHGTIVDLPDEQIRALDAYSKKYGVYQGGGRSASGGKFSPETPASESGFSESPGVRFLEKSRSGLSRISKQIASGIGRSLVKAVFDTDIVATTAST